MRSTRICASLLLSAVMAASASLPWKGKDPKQWTKDEVERVLNESPWAQSAAASFPEKRDDTPQSVYTLPGPAQAGMPAPRNAATDGRWDGGVARNTGRGMVPNLPVLVRWESALPVRQAELRGNELKLSPELGAQAVTALQEPRSYVLSVWGLIPAHQYGAPGTANVKSSSDSDEGTRAPLSTEQVLEGLMANTRLLVRGREALHPEDVKLDGATGRIQIFFPRNAEIQKSAKEVVFVTRFGSLTVEKRFRLSDMMYQNRLEL